MCQAFSVHCNLGEMHFAQLKGLPGIQIMVLHIKINTYLLLLNASEPHSSIDCYDDGFYRFQGYKYANRWHSGKRKGTVS